MNYKEYMKIKDNLCNQILLTAHEPCITLGKNSTENEIIQNINLPVFYSNRGGNACYHDNGQLMIYPHIKLQRPINLKQYIKILLNWVINAAKKFEIKLTQKEQPGLWFNEKKVAFMGLAIKKGIAQHGMGINLSECEIKNFDSILPCNCKQKVTKLNINKKQFIQALQETNPFQKETKINIR